MLDQEGEAERHVEIERRRYLAERGERALDEPGHRLAVIDIERAAVAQHEVEIVVGAERMVPRQPVDDDRRPRRQEGPELRDHLLVGAQHRLRVDDALGQSGRARGEENLRHRVGARRRMGGVRRRARAGRRQRGEFRRAGGRIDRHDDLQRDDVAQFGEILRQARIGDRDRHHRHADMQRAERQQRVVDAVLRQDDDRPLGREAAREKGAADGARRLPRLPVTDPSPAVAPALGEKDPLGEKDALGRRARPVPEPFAEPARIRFQLLARPQDAAAIGALLDGDVGGGKEKVVHRIIPEPSPSGRGQGEGSRRLSDAAGIGSHPSPHPNPLPEGEGIRSAFQARSHRVRSRISHRRVAPRHWPPARRYVTA